jgi:uncharacterized protein (TIGR00369 family)
MPSLDSLARYAAEFNASQALTHFGMKVSFPDPEHVQVELNPIRPEHRGGLGTEAVNGGVLAALFDLVIGCSAALVDPTRRTATMQLSMSFQRPVRGTRLKAVASIDSAGDTVLFSSARVEDEQGAVCARCQGVIRLSKQPWQSGRSPSIG